MVDAKELEQHLSTRSYIDGNEPSTADVAVFESLKLSEVTQPHTARWYKHIASYAGETPSLKSGKVPFAGVAAVAAGAGAAAGAAAAAAADDDDEDIDLFGSDDEDDEEAERIKQERVAKYNADRKAKEDAKIAKGQELAVAKSVVTLAVKPWDDETDMAELEKLVRSIEKDGLVWGASKLVPVGYGIKMLQITLVVEDAKISLDELQEQIAEDGEEWVQSSDVLAMQKL